MINFFFRIFIIINALQSVSCSIKKIEQGPSSKWKMDSVNSFRQFIEDEDSFDKTLKLLNKFEIDSAIYYLHRIKGIHKQEFKYSNLSNIYLEKGLIDSAKYYYVKQLSLISSFSENIDTNFISQHEGAKYLKKRNGSLLKLISDISYRDLYYRGYNNVGNQDSLDKINQEEFKNYVNRFGWPNICKTGNDYEVKGFNTFLYHLPNSLHLEFLDSSMYYCLRGEDTWFRAQIMLSNLFIDKSLSTGLAVSTIYGNCDNKIDDIELLELYSIVNNSIKWTKNIKLLVYYKAEYQTLALSTIEIINKLCNNNCSVDIVEIDKDQDVINFKNQDCLFFKLVR